MVESAPRIVAYMNASLKKAGLKAVLQFGRQTDSSNHGIYFFRRQALPNQAADHEEILRILSDPLHQIDAGARTVLEEFLSVNDRILNKGAVYIPLDKVPHIAQYLGVTNE